MLIRIVKMGFYKEHICTFLSNFDANREKIRAFEGCTFLELYQDKQESNIFFTYSYWRNETDLDKYRQSDLFKNVWSKTKPLFDRKPEAWSVEKIVSLN
ncbi:putative quinol monooxygenase [Gaetbulibacter saemankumensis]|uniref:putative quinol monooxygenase n=1 Tax=Gaetbulibacter saemankumensis TaxID=311208 RepID=UPI00048A3593|nr:antibiotic biosynthesis monooxygenase [Gaetbulibacter saemankumensis]